MYTFLWNLAVILLSAKLMGLAARRFQMPQVVGEIIAGLLLGPSVFNLVQTSDDITLFAEIGVIMLLFSTGLGTNLKQLVRTGSLAFSMALAGVIVPLVLGTLLYGAFYGLGAIGSTDFFKAVFVGTILTATSVSITAATLQELGKLKTEIGAAIVNAAVVDDVIGIVVLTCVMSAGGESGESVLMVLVKIVLFFLFSLVVGFFVNRIVERVDRKNPHSQRLPIFALSFCFLMAYIADTYFGIADITGAYIAGVSLCTVDDASYIENRVDISDYLLFSPVFFASIGLKTQLSGFTPAILMFSIAFILVGLIGKIVGCGAVAKLYRFSNLDSLIAGVGMMTRGEVALIVAQKGLDTGLIDATIFTPVILLIIVSSVLTPLCLKMLFAKRPEETPTSVQKV